MTQFPLDIFLFRRYNKDSETKGRFLESRKVMKKVILFAVSLAMLLACLSLPTLAETHTHEDGDIVATFTVSSVSAKAGDTVKVTVSVTECTVTSIGLVPLFESYVTPVSGKWLIEGELTDGWDAETNFPVIAWEESTKISGDIFEFTLEVDDDAPNGATAPVTLDRAFAKNVDAEIHTHVSAGQLTISGESEKKGCGSSVSSLAVLLCAAGSAVMLRKKDR